MFFDESRGEPSVYRHKGKVVYASEICGVVFLRDEHGHFYVSTDKKLAARIMLVSYAAEITATFEVLERGTARAAVNVRLDMEEVFDEEKGVLLLNEDQSYNQLLQNTDNSSLLQPIPFILPQEEEPLVDSTIKDIAALEISSNGAPGAAESIGMTWNCTPTVIPTNTVINKNDSTLHDTMEDVENEVKLKVDEKKKQTKNAEMDDKTDLRKKLKVEKVWYEFPERVENVLKATDFKSRLRQSRLLNVWWYVPSKRNKTDYPFPCCGICVPIPGTNQIKIITQRSGCVIKDEDPKRRGLPIAYFFVFGEGDYRSFEYSQLVCTLISVTPVDSFPNCGTMSIIVRGYAVVSSSNGAENTWHAWNDYCGSMKCDVGCASEQFRKKKPECQLVRFEAVTQKGDWTIKKLTEINDPLSQQVNYFPADLFFINDVHPLKDKKQSNGLPVFVSKQLDSSEIIVEREHAYLGKNFSASGILPLMALVFITWAGGHREFRALVIGIRENLSYKSFKMLAGTLKLNGWDAKRKFSAVDEKAIPAEP